MSISIPSRRLVLRRFSDDDIRDLIELASDPSFASEVSELEPVEESARKYIALRNEPPPFEENQIFDLGIERRKTGK